MVKIMDYIENGILKENEKRYIYSNPSDFIITIRAFEKNLSINTLLIEAKDKTEEALSVIKSMYQYVSAAGGIVLNKNRELLFIHRFNKWDLPKGHVEEGESIDDAAIREVIEETAVESLKIESYIGSTFHIYFLFNTWCIKETHYFLMNTTSNAPLVPQLSEAIVAATWIKKEQVLETLNKSYTSIKAFIIDNFTLFYPEN